MKKKHNTPEGQWERGHKSYQFFSRSKKIELGSIVLHRATSEVEGKSGAMIYAWTCGTLTGQESTLKKARKMVESSNHIQQRQLSFFNLNGEVIVAS